MYLIPTIKNKKLALAILLLVVAVEFVVLAKQKNLNGITISPQRASKLASLVVKRCEAADYKPTCYEEEIPALMDAISLEDAFLVTKEVQKVDSSLSYCHVLGHKISYTEAEKRPASWKEILPRCPFTMCNYGCLHGSMIQHFRGEVLSSSQIRDAVGDLKDVCEPRDGWEPTEIDKTMCYHALGHLAMYITGADLTGSTDICRQVGIKSDGRNYYETCVEGVFMTVYQGVDPEDVALVKHIKPQKEEVNRFCSDFSGIDYEACNRESYPLFREDFKDPLEVVNFCSYTKNEHGSWKCYATVLGDIAVESLESGSLDETKSYCLNLPEDTRGQCFANIAVRLVQVEPNYIGKSVEICRVAEGVGEGEECFRDLVYFSDFAFKEGSDEKEAFCSSLDEERRRECLGT